LKGSILISNVSKKYKRYPTHWARLGEWLSLGTVRMHDNLWALKDISFGIQPGESVGIIGQNGAGKSTLLKILTGTANPTQGEVQTQGDVAALLELGLGFHHNFTGTANAIMTCQMMGLSTEESKRLLPTIAEFSELGEYLKQPMRVYSTGMQVRLAFSAATAVRSDILVVDEALSVGDSYFQHKCTKRIRQFKEAGTTLLFVSHDPGAVKSLCDRALLLDQGEVVQDGTPDVVLDYYNALIAQKRVDEGIQQFHSQGSAAGTRSGTGKVRIGAVDMQSAEGQSQKVFRVGEAAQIRCRLDFNSAFDNPTVGFVIRDRLGNEIFGTNTYHLKLDTGAHQAGDRIEMVYSTRLNLGAGHYAISMAVHTGDTHLDDNCDWWDQCLVFQIVPGDENKFIGSSALPIEARVVRR
jgi:lipopolysaccharide transport system ATP-binding protein